MTGWRIIGLGGPDVFRADAQFDVARSGFGGDFAVALLNRAAPPVHLNKVSERELVEWPCRG
jgi:hypothetical protein